MAEADGAPGGAPDRWSAIHIRLGLRAPAAASLRQVCGTGMVKTDAMVQLDDGVAAAVDPTPRSKRTDLIRRTSNDIRHTNLWRAALPHEDDKALAFNKPAGIAAGGSASTGRQIDGFWGMELRPAGVESRVQATVFRTVTRPVRWWWRPPEKLQRSLTQPPRARHGEATIAPECGRPQASDADLPGHW